MHIGIPPGRDSSFCPDVLNSRMATLPLTSFELLGAIRKLWEAVQGWQVGSKGWKDVGEGAAAVENPGWLHRRKPTHFRRLSSARMIPLSAPHLCMKD